MIFHRHRCGKRSEVLGCGSWWAGPAFPALLSALLIVLLAGSAAAGSWPQQKRATYIHLGIRGFQGTSYYGPGGEKVALSRLEEETYAMYSEYGYSRYVTGIVSVPAYRKLLVQEFEGGPTEMTHAPGDIDLGLRIGVYAGDNDVISLTGMFGIPLGETTSPNGLWTGDDEFNQLVMLGYGHSFYPFPAWISVQAGYNFRSEGYADEIHATAEAGVQPWSFLQVMFEVYAVRSRENGASGFVGGSYGFASNNQRYLVYGPKIALWFTDSFGLSVAVHSAANARNVPSALAIATGLNFKLTSDRID